MNYNREDRNIRKYIMKKSWKELEQDDELYYIFLNLHSTVFGPIIEKVLVHAVYENSISIGNSSNFSYYKGFNLESQDSLVNVKEIYGECDGIRVLGFSQEDVINRCKKKLKEIYSERKDEILNDSEYKLGIEISVASDKLEAIKIPENDDPLKEVRDLKSGDVVYGIYIDSSTAKFEICSTKVTNNADFSKYIKEESPCSFKTQGQGTSINRFMYFCSLTKAIEYIRNNLNILFSEKVQPKIEKLEQLDREFQAFKESLQNPGRAVE